jgi:metal-sulfur cluster biosynthetic enzyme
MTDKNEIVRALEHVEDPEIGMNIVDLGLIYGLDWDEERGHVHVDLTLTSPGCPLGPELIRNIKRELRPLDEVLDVDVAPVNDERLRQGRTWLRRRVGHGPGLLLAAGEYQTVRREEGRV